MSSNETHNKTRRYHILYIMTDHTPSKHSYWATRTSQPNNAKEHACVDSWAFQCWFLHIKLKHTHDFSSQTSIPEYEATCDSYQGTWFRAIRCLILQGSQARPRLLPAPTMRDSWLWIKMVLWMPFPLNRGQVQLRWDTKICRSWLNPILIIACMHSAPLFFFIPAASSTIHCRRMEVESD